MSGLALRKAARKVARLERRWGRVAFAVPHPGRRSDRLARRIARLSERSGDLRAASHYRSLAGDREAGRELIRQRDAAKAEVERLRAVLGRVAGMPTGGRREMGDVVRLAREALKGRAE